MFKFGNIKVSKDDNPLVIPEIGINHEGSLEIAKIMVDAAKEAGAKVVKHQTHVVDDEMSSDAKKVIPGNSKDSIYEIMKRCALSSSDELKLKEYIESLNMEFISTPFSRAAALRLEEFGVKAYKIGSGECNNYPLIDLIASFKKPIILSTGMNNIESIQKSVNIIESYNTPLAIMHTTNLYPTPPHLIRYGAMMQMHDAFSHLEFGLSDHSLNNNACIGAVALGANILERHFSDTLNRNGPDIVCSMDKQALSELIISSKEVSQMRGGRKEATKEEQVTIDFAFATVVTIKNIKKGELFTKDNIWVKRPGTGEITAEEFTSILGKTSKHDIDNDTHLRFGDII